jgi:hypothetical protein
MIYIHCGSLWASIAPNKEINICLFISKALELQKMAVELIQIEFEDFFDLSIATQISEPNI